MNNGNSRTVLVVEDDEDLLWLMADVLTTAGYAVDTASDGREALEVVSRRVPSLILLDMKMPVMDGWQFAKELRLRYDHQLPIIVVTAAEDARKRAEEVGAVGWLGKPFELDALIATVRRFLPAP